VLVIINENEVCLDLCIFAIIEFELLIGHPLDNVFQEKPSQGSLDEKFGKTASAIPIIHPEIPMAKHNLNHDPDEG
jgi:hypothetical protein